jgi:hypothetical protein
VSDGRVLLVVGSAYGLHTGNVVNRRRQQLRNRLVPFTTRCAPVSPPIEVRVADRPEHDADQGRPSRNDG